MDELEGAGEVAGRGSKVDLRYTMKLNRGDVIHDNEFLSFQVGERRVIAGIEYGVEGMRAGGRRRLRIGPHLAYGEKGVPGKIPQNAVLIVEILLISTKYQEGS